MKTITLTLWLLFISVVNSSFSQLLRKDVYDFSVGDIHSVRFKMYEPATNFYGNVRYEMYRIIEKEYNSDSSQVTYFAQRQTYIPPLPLGNGSGTPSEFFIDSITVSYAQLLSDYSTNLNGGGFGCAQPMLDNYPFSCTRLDSSYTTESCNSFTFDQFNFGIVINVPDSCSAEVQVSNYYVVEKIGGPYGEWHYLGMTDPTASFGGTFLDYYYKNGEACGDFPPYFLGMEELEVSQFKIYPVPSSGKLHIDGEVKIERIELMDLMNKVVTESNGFLTEKDIDISSLPSGIYVLRIYKGAGKYENHRVIKQ